MLVSAFFILLTLITFWVVMHFIAPALLKDEHRRVHDQINEHTAAVTQLMSRVQAQQRVLTETVAQLESAQIDRLLRYPKKLAEPADLQHSAALGDGADPAAVGSGFDSDRALYDA